MLDCCSQTAAGCVWGQRNLWIAAGECQVQRLYSTHTSTLINVAVLN